MPPPDRWEIYSNVGNVIPGTRFICFKTPLKQALQSRLEDDMKFSPDTLISFTQDKGYNLGLIIDLTFTSKYYSPKAFTNQGIQYLKIPTFGHHVPIDDVVYRFFDAVENMKAENAENDNVIGVHCTHGVNRTGYLVCRYMIEILAFSPEEAIQAFSTARGHPVERKNYIDDLMHRTHNPDYKNENRHTLPVKAVRLGNYTKNGHEYYATPADYPSGYSSYCEPSASGSNRVRDQFQHMARDTYSSDKNNHSYARQDSDGYRHHPYKECPNSFQDGSWRDDWRDQRDTGERGRVYDDQGCQSRDHYSNYRRQNYHGNQKEGYQRRGYRGRGGYRGNSGRGYQNRNFGDQGYFRHRGNNYENFENDGYNSRTQNRYHERNQDSFYYEPRNHYRGNKDSHNNTGHREDRFQHREHQDHKGRSDSGSYIEENGQHYRNQRRQTGYYRDHGVHRGHHNDAKKIVHRDVS